MTGNYPELMREVAPLLGYDPRAADRRGIARYRSHGSLKIDFARGTFSDFEAGVAGGVLDFIRYASGEDAGVWLERQGFAARRYSQRRAIPAPQGASRRDDKGTERRDFTADELERIADALRIWDQGEPIDGAPEVVGYLTARGGLDVSGCKDELRYNPTTVWEFERRKCLLVAYRNLYTNELTGISRILLDEPERWPKTHRKMLGVVRLAGAKLATVTDTLAVAEGVETALAANMLGHGPAWALGSAGAVGCLPVLHGIERLILLQENNDPSSEAVGRCGRRWMRAGRNVIRVRPDDGCDDLNDELISKRAS